MSLRPFPTAGEARQSVRAGVVAQPEDYRWSGYGEAVGGGRRAALARDGLERALAESGVEAVVAAGGKPPPGITSCSAL